MSKHIEAVVFDWAGTTVDFGSFAPVQSFIEGFQQFGITPTIDEVREPMGMLKWHHIHTMMQMPRISQEWETIHGNAWTTEDVDAVYAASEAALMSVLHHYATPKPYVLDAVHALRERGIKIGSTTGYTDEMMGIVVPMAAEQGYAPDFWCTPNSVNNMGRPYPYMIFKNLEMLKVMDATSVLKIGDTVSDIKEGIHAGLITVGVIEGSSVMSLSEKEYDALNEDEKAAAAKRTETVYRDCGADYVIHNMSGLMTLIAEIER